MIDIDSLTISEAKNIAAIFGGATPSCIAHAQDAHWCIGKNYFIRTVTHHHAGKLVGVTDKELILENASWIPDDGRFTDALKSCAFAEVEMFPASSQVIIGRGSIIDAVQISTIPTSQK